MRQKTFRLLALILVLSILAVTGWSFFLYHSYTTAKSLVKEQFNNHQLLLVKEIAMGIEEDIKLLVRELELLSKSPAAKNLNLKDGRGVMEETFDYVKTLHVNDMALIDSRGIVRIALMSPQLEGSNFSDREYFKRAAALKTLTPVYEFITLKGVDIGGKGVVIAMPFFTADKKFGGVIFFTLKISELIKEFIPESPGSTLCVVDTEGDCLYQHGQGTCIVGGDISKYHISHKSFLENVKAGKADKAEYISPEGMKIVAASYPVKIGKQALSPVICTPEKTISELLTSLFVDFIAATAIGFLIIVGTSFAIVYVVDRWGSELAEVNKQLQEEITERKRTEDELMRYRDHLEDMAKERTAELTKVNEQLKIESAERKLAQEALLAVTEPLDIVDRNYRIVWANEARARVYQRPLHEMIGQHCYEMFQRRNSPCDGCPVTQALRTGKPSTHECFANLPDGTHILAEVHAWPIFNDKGEITHVVEYARDITERKKMEEQLFQITHDWQDTFDTITDMITIHDKDFNIIRANKAAEKILKLPFLANAKVKCYKYYHGAECPPEWCPSCQSLKTGEPSTSEMFEPNLNMFIEIRAIPRFDPDKNLVGLIHVVRNITERKRLESQLRQAQKMEAIGQLAGGVAHDFNNFLTAIIGYGNLLQMKIREDDPLMMYARQILAASEKAANLTQSLLAFSKKQISNPEPTNINGLIIGLEKLLSRVIGEDIELRVILTGDLTVMADGIQIEQVLMNLCTNARDAMPHGGTLIIETELIELDREFITAHGYGEPGVYVLISVTDTGTGMDESTRERIFEPFFTTKEIGKGTGLGLSIVYGIVKQHNGFINCYSEPGKGTTFKIYLPAIKAEVQEAKTEEIHELIPATETVLLAEDEEEVRSLAKQILEEAGYKVIDAVDGEDAVNKFMENKDKIDLLLFDVIMPKMSGKEAYDRINKMRPGIKLLLTSGYPADFISREDIFEKRLDFIPKPISPTALLKKVREVLNK